MCCRPDVRPHLPLLAGSFTQALELVAEPLLSSPCALRQAVTAQLYRIVTVEGHDYRCRIYLTLLARVISVQQPTHDLCHESS